jgi:hypothetical protein
MTAALWAIAIAQTGRLILSVYEKRAKGLLRPLERRRKAKSEPPKMSVTSMP